MKKYYKFIFMALFGLFIFMPKDTFALPVITSGMSYYKYNTTETSTVVYSNKAFVTTGSTVVYPFTSYQNTNFIFGYHGVQFVTSSVGSTEAIGYTITATYKILFDGMDNNVGNNTFTGYAKFQQGSVVSETSNVQVIGLTTGGATFKVSTTAQLASSTTLSTILVDLSTSGAFGLAYSGDTFTVQLTLLSLDVQYATSLDSAILNSLNSNQQQTNQKLDDIKEQNEQIKEETKKQTEEQKKTNEILEDTDTSDAQNKGSNFFKNYNADAHGLAGVITAPLKFLQSLTGAKCEPLTFQLPFVHEEVELKCMKSIYQEHFGVFYTLWQTITTGLISYTVCLNFYKKIRDLQNPNNDKIEVLNL